MNPGRIGIGLGVGICDINACNAGGSAPAIVLPYTTGRVWHLKSDAGTYQTSGGAIAAANNDPIGELQDQSGAGRHATQPTAGLKPLLKTNVLNGLPVIRFDGVDDFLRNSSNFNFKSIFALAKYSNATFAGDYRSLVFGTPDTGNNDFWLGNQDGTTWFNSGWNQRKNGIASNTGPMNVFAVLSASRVAGGDATAGWTLGAYTVGSARFWLGDVVEVIAYDHIPLNLDRDSIEGYLNARGGTIY